MPGEAQLVPFLMLVPAIYAGSVSDTITGMKSRRIVFAVILCFLAAAKPGNCAEPVAAPLPQDVKAVWDVSKAYRETTPTRERVCLNGLWRWQPADARSEQVPAENWGHFKVPACWPGITDYMQKDCQMVSAIRAGRASGSAASLRHGTSARLRFPLSGLAGVVTVCVEYLNSYAAVYVDGRRAGGDAVSRWRVRPHLGMPAGRHTPGSACWWWPCH